MWTSLSYHFNIWGLDSDTADLVLLWQGIRRYGFQFVKTWGYTPDNWLFTLLPPTALLSSVFGPKPVLVIGLGWLIFCANVVMVAAITWQVSRRAAIVTIPLLLLLGPDALGSAGFLSHPVSHNSTMLYGLAALLGAFAWISRGSVAGVCVLTTALTAAVLSDPWAAAAFALPVAAAAGYGMLTERNCRLAFGVCAGIAMSSLALLYTQAFGWLSFAGNPSEAFELTDWAGFVANLSALSRCIGLSLNPLPGVGSASPIPSLVTCPVIIVLATYSGWIARRHWASWRPAVRFLVIASGLACIVPICAFLAGSFPNDLAVGRFVMPLTMMLPALMLVALDATRLRSSGKLLIGVFVLFLAVGGALSNPSAWLRTRPVVETGNVRELASFLDEHGLRYGYGPYWGTQANGIVWVSGGSVIVRPVEFDESGHIARRFGQTSSLWYQADDLPATMTSFFVAVRQGPDACPDLAVCLRGVQDQFGPADRILLFGRIHLLIWTGKKPFVPDGWLP